MNLTLAQLLALAQGAGQGGDPTTAAAVARAESAGDPAAVGQNSDGSRDRGLWQINDRWHPEVTDACAFDARCNASAAFTISNGWTDFSPWTTYNTGAYAQFMPEAGTVPQDPPGRSLYGQQVVGQAISSPWFGGTWEITQGWGPTDYGGEPEGHGYQHWHAGVDVGVDCGTTIVYPMGHAGAVARSLDNPDGYGTALVLLIDGGPAIILSHLRQRLVDDGTILTGGEEIAISNSTGNSTGCHLHFEVRPQDAKRPLGMARYGTDVDPSSWLLTATGNPDAALLAASSSAPGLGDVITQAGRTLIAGGEVLLGTATLLAGIIAAVYGLRGQSAGTLAKDARARGRQLLKPAPQPRTRRAPQPTSEAAESRVRPDLQRQPAGRRP